MIRAIIFDFDGLILDTETPDYEAWREVYRVRGYELPLEMHLKGVGTNHSLFDPYTHLGELLGLPIDRELIRAEKRRRVLERILKQPVMPGVIDRLDEAATLGLGLAVASSSPREWVHGHLQRIGLLTRFQAICCGDEVPAIKPAPDLFLAAVRALGVQPAETIVFEDSLNGLLAARAAGCHAIAVPNAVTRHLDLTIAHRIVASLAEITLKELTAECHLTGDPAPRPST